ncbi:MAG: efflux RND transporter periplasmic adaptor subunit [Candidatus Kapaibacteriota bacterium]
MKKILIPAGIIAFLAIIIGILEFNKSKAEQVIVKQTFVQNAIPVTVAQAEITELRNALTLVGTIMAGSDVNIVTEAGGRILKLYANPGQFKSAGSVIAEIDSELRRASVMNAQAAYDKAKIDYERMEKMFKEGVMNAMQLDQAKYGFQAAEAQLIMSKRQLRDTKVTTPISGIINTKMVDQGATVGMNAVIANIVDISSLKVKVNVSEKDAFALKTGDKVLITTDVYPGIEFPGSVMSIAPKADEAHTYPIEIRMSNSKEHPLKAGMFGKVSFTTIEKSDALIIPRSALIGSIKNPKVFVVQDGKAELREVQTGADAGTKLEILSGLQAGESIVTNGQNNLRPGSKVTIINKK